MTAEVVILNHQGIALAADSAVTIGRERVWKTANKIFSCGPHNDIAVMINNSGEFLGIPWEVVIKQHRSSCGNQRFATVNDYCNDLISYIKQIDDGNDLRESFSFFMLCVDVAETIASDLDFDSRAEFHTNLLTKINASLAEMDDSDELVIDLAFNDFKKQYKSLITDMCEDVFPYTLKREAAAGLVELIYKSIVRKYESDYSTGLVIAGYGDDELFPVVQTYVVDGRWLNHFRCWSDEVKSADLNKKPVRDGCIIPFAQSDMATLFLEGLYPKYLDYMRQMIRVILEDKSSAIIDRYVVDKDERTVEKAIQAKDDDKIVSALGAEFKNYRQIEFINPLMKTVNALPKEEMAFIAKAIVELTALRRKFTSNLESVGGAVDLALISKSDGFIWIDRKHYFDIDFNKEFLDRKKIRQGGSNEADSEKDRPHSNSAKQHRLNAETELRNSRRPRRSGQRGRNADSDIGPRGTTREGRGKDT